MSDRRCRVSLCMIVRDEERNLAACLSPVAHLFDEIVIVDTGSHDNTKQIARSFTPHVYDFAWCDDFSAARNESVRRATGEWIFWLDADDRLSPENVARLSHLLDHELTDHPRVFLIDTVLAPVVENEEPSLVTHARLFRRSPRLSWEGRVHEQLQPNFPTLGYEQVFTDLQIDHIGYCDDVLRARKERRKIRLLRMDYAIDPHKPSTLLHLGMSLAHSNRPEAQRHLQQLLEIHPGHMTFLRRAYCTLAELLLLEQKPRAAAELTERGLALFPDDEHLQFVQASAWYRLQEYSRVTVILERIINRCPARHMQFGASANIRGKLAPRLLGTVLRLQKHYRESEQALLALLQQFPEDNIAWFDLGMVYLDAISLENMAVVVRELLKRPTGAIEAGTLTALWHLRHGDPLPAGPIIDQLIADAPHLANPRMLRCEWLSRCGAPLTAQSQALRDLLRVDPGNTEASVYLKTIEFAQSETTSSAALQPNSSGALTSIFAPATV